MKVRILKLLFLILVASFSTINLTGSYFADEERINGLTFSTGCWAAPSVPQLVYPTNEYSATPETAWLSNPYMDWENSTSTCPSATITYQYESYHDVGLTQLAYRSGWLTDSQIPAPGTPDGTYYWQVRAQDQFGHISEFSVPWLLTVNRSVPPPESPPPTVSGVVLNEIMYNPVGDYDNGLMPNGEWVELYNNSDGEIDVNGWRIRDASDSNEIVISSSNGDSNQNTSDDGETIVPAHGWLVVYRNGGAMFNNGGDTVSLYNGSLLIDSHTYEGGKSGGYTEARISDGTGDWQDPVATPGGPNKLEESGPKVEFGLRSDKRAVYFKAREIKEFSQLSYEIIYDTDGEDKGMVGTIELSGENTVSRHDLILGTCSTFGKVCVYDTGITKITLKVVLTLANGQTTEIIKEIAYY